jgi:hypothetical protein
MEIVVTSYTPSKGWQIPLPDYDSPSTLVLVFGDSTLRNHAQPFVELEHKYPLSLVAGCSGAGEIINDRVVSGSLVVAVVRFSDTRLRLAIRDIQNVEDSLRVGSELAQELKEDSLKSVLLLADGLKTNGSQLVKGIYEYLDDHVVISGGLAGDQDKFEVTWVLKDGRPKSHVISAIGFYGDTINAMCSSQGGWKPFGPQRVVTRSKGAILYELDGKPVLPLYKEYLGERSKDLPASALLYPLAIWLDDSDEFVVRTILDIDEQNESMRFAGDIPEGCNVQLMYGTFDNLIEGAEDAAARLPEIISHNNTALAIAISCIGRKLVMENDVAMELEATMDAMSPGTRQIGFYSYGELAPKEDGICALHNETMTLTVIYEQ